MLIVDIFQLLDERALGASALRALKRSGVGTIDCFCLRVGGLFGVQVNPAKMMCRRVTDKLKPQKKISSKGPAWVPDKDVSECANCGFEFSLFIRKHHCRMCGKVFCTYCAGDKWPIPKLEYIQPVRVCIKCKKLCWKAEAIVAAINANDVAAMQRYVDRKMDCNLHTGVYPPLTVAASSGLVDMCKILIKGGADVNHQVPGFHECIPVQCAFCLRTNAFTPNSAGDYECVVCHEITHIDSRDSRVSFHVGVTALHASLSLREHAEVAELLLDQGADISSTNGQGDTALHLAAAGGFARVTVILLARGAAVDPISVIDGDTPLHRAAAGGHAEVVRLLVAAGANVAAKNSHGKSVRQLADQSRSTTVLAALSSAAL